MVVWHRGNEVRPPVGMRTWGFGRVIGLAGWTLFRGLVILTGTRWGLGTWDKHFCIRKKWPGIHFFPVRIQQMWTMKSTKTTKWNVNMLKCSKYYAKWQVLVPNCCTYKANGCKWYQGKNPNLTNTKIQKLFFTLKKAYSCVLLNGSGLFHGFLHCFSMLFMLSHLFFVVLFHLFFILCHLFYFLKISSWFVIIFAHLSTVFAMVHLASQVIVFEIRRWRPGAAGARRCRFSPEPAMTTTMVYYNVYLCVCVYMEVSWNRGTPKSSIFMGFSLINPPFWGTPIYGNPHMGTSNNWRCWIYYLYHVCTLVIYHGWPWFTDVNSIKWLCLYHES